MSSKTGSLGLLLLMAACAVSAGQVYKWVDAQGQIHYSDTPKPGWTRVDLQAAPGFAPAMGAPGTAQDAEAESPERAQLRAEECEKRRGQLETYRNATTITERDSLGNERTFTEEQRLQLIEQTQRQVSELCADS